MQATQIMQALLESDRGLYWQTAHFTRRSPGYCGRCQRTSQRCRCSDSSSDSSSDSDTDGSDGSEWSEHKRGDTALHVAARNGQVEALEQLLQLGADPNSTNGRDDTALHEAARNGHTKALRQLLQHGANPEAKNVKHTSPVQDAACNWHPDALRVLLESIEDAGRLVHSEFAWLVECSIGWKLPSWDACAPQISHIKKGKMLDPLPAVKRGPLNHDLWFTVLCGTTDANSLLSMLRHDQNTLCLLLDLAFRKPANAIDLRKAVEYGEMAELRTRLHMTAVDVDATEDNTGRGCLRVGTCTSGGCTPILFAAFNGQTEAHLFRGNH